MGPRRRHKLSIGLFMATLMLVTVPAASALASAKVRFVNARGGSSALRLEIAVGSQKASVGAVSFGQASPMTSVAAGEAKLSVHGASAQQTLTDDAAYTVVALPKGSKGVKLHVLRNGKPRASQAKIRLVHAAPELGSPDVKLGKRTIAQGVKFNSASPYLTIDPGTYDLAITKPSGGATVFHKTVSLAAGTATTVVVAGSGGTATRLIELNDATVTPAGAPHTGFGGLARSGGAPWALALLAALVAGTLGGALQLARTRRSRP